MRILQVVTRLGLGGAERVAETLASKMVADGNEVNFAAVAASRDMAIANEMRANLEQAGVGVIDGGSVASARIAVLGAAGRLADAVERLRPDLVHLHTEIPEFAWALAGLRSNLVRRLPVVRTVHNTVLWGGWRRAGRFAENRLQGARVAAVSVAASDAFTAWRAETGRPANGTVVIYNGVDLAGLAPGPREPVEPPLLCFAGRYERQKGIDVLLDALALMTDDHQPFRVAIHGSGALEPLVVEAAKLAPDRIAVGPPIVDLRSRLASFDAILLPSRFEGLSLLALEALCTGVPIVATSAAGPAEAIPDWYPGRCPPGDPVAYAGVINDFLENRGTWREQALRARGEARRRFSLDTMVAAYERFYAVALEGAHAV